MTNPTRQEIINAHEELEKLCQRLPATRAAKETILRALPPFPRPTMNEIEWDDDEHFLAEAEHPDWGKVVMLRESALIIFVQPIEKRMGDIHVARVEELTPTGRRYTLTEEQE
ncbi:hypothetical protein [Corynebacterium marquesiae]|uniref:hypothetical protein n=1 Tax=Corynebacterium marquesiae TaxID=2913503 RepID=UPI0032EF8696